MANATVQAGRRQSFPARVLDLEHRTKPEQARLVLTATAGTLAAGLLIWLLCWIGSDRGPEVAFVIPPEPVGPILPFQAQDIGRFSPALRPDDGARGAPPSQAEAKAEAKAEEAGDAAAKAAPPPPIAGGPKAADYVSLKQVLERPLAEAGRRPVVIYLSAAGVSDRSVARAYLLPAVEGSLETIKTGQDLVTVERLLGLCQQYEDAKKLLILDVGQVGTDRNLGVFANGFPQRLREALRTKPPKNLAVLCAGAPGQTSWGSEFDRCTVFGHYVARGLAGQAVGWDLSRSGLTVQGLAHYVRHHVCRWVWDHRQAVQTPELLGDPGLNFALRKLPPALADLPRPAPAEAVEALWQRLAKAWEGRDARAARSPARRDPLLWRRYLETLLRAERLLRAGLESRAEQTLASLAELERELDRPATSGPERFHSLAMADRHLPDDPRSPARAGLAAASEALDRALKGLIAPPAPAAAPPPAEASGMPNPPGDAPTAAGAPATAPTAAAAPKAATPKSDAPPARPRRVQGPGGDADETVPEWVEDQLLAWADAFARARQGGDFGDHRRELLVRAMGVRRLAEEAAAAPERVLGRVAPLVEAGDAHRRKAQDLLFSGGGEPAQQAVAELEAAADLYREAIRGVEVADRALDLVERLAAELPYFGEWIVRSSVRRSQAPDEELGPLLEAAVALARLFDPAAPEPRSGDELTRSRAWIVDLEPKYRAARGLLEKHREQFDESCRRLKATAVASRWRELDDLLCVPLIPAETRTVILKRVRSAEVATSLAGPDRPAPRKPADLADLGLPAGIVAGADEAAGAAAGDGAPAMPADPAFWAQAAGMARLEWGLLQLGGAEDKGLAQVDAAFGAAARARGPARFEACETLSAEIRALRDRQVERIKQSRADRSEDDDLAEQALVAADRAARTLPPADLLALAGEPAERLGRFRRYALLLWHGRRLLADFAPRHAQVLLDDARARWQQTAALSRAVAEAQAMDDAKLAVATLPAEGLTIETWANQPLRVEVKAAREVPPGDAVVSIRRGQVEPMTITVEGSGRDAREGALVAVSPDAPGTVRYLAARTYPEGAKVVLAPDVFYRGRRFGSGALGVELKPVIEPISIALRQDYEPLQNKNFTDQLLEHPNDCYLHPGGFMFYKVVITNNTDERLQVDAQVDVEWKKSSEADRKVLTLIPDKAAEIKGKVTYSEVPIGEPKKLTVTVKDKADRLKVFRREFVFHQIPAEQYMTASAGVTPGGIFYLTIHHLASDPVTGWSEIEPWVQTTGRIEPLGIPVNNDPRDKIRIRRGETLNFSGQITAPGDITWSVHVEKDPKPLSGKIVAPKPDAPAAAGPKL